MKIIAFGHYSRTGKNTLAQYVINHMNMFDPAHRIVRKGFADKIKQHCYELYAWTGLRESEFYETKQGARMRTEVLPDLGMTPIELWVTYGTNAIRDNVYDRTWIDVVLKGTTDVDTLLITDLRFPNEVDSIREMGGHICKVVRPGIGPKNTVADQALLGFEGWDNIVGLDGKLTSLESAAQRYALWLLGHGKEPKLS